MKVGQDGFEKVDLPVPMRAYQLAGAQIDVVSLRRGRIRGGMGKALRGGRPLAEIIHARPGEPFWPVFR